MTPPLATPLRLSFPANILFKPLESGPRQAADVMGTIDEHRHTTLGEIEQDLLAMLPIVDNHEDDIRQMAAMLTQDIRDEFGGNSTHFSLPLLLRFAHQGKKSKIADIADPGIMARVVVVPMQAQESLHATIADEQGAEAIDRILGEGREKFVLMATASLTQPGYNPYDEYTRQQEPLSKAEIDALRKMVGVLNQAMADAMSSPDAGFGLSGLTGAVQQMTQKLNGYKALPQTGRTGEIASLSAVAVRQSVVQVEKQLRSQVGNIRLPARVRQSLRSSLHQLQKARMLPDNKIKPANAAASRLQTRATAKTATVANSKIAPASKASSPFNILHAGRPATAATGLSRAPSAQIIKLATHAGRALPTNKASLAVAAKSVAAPFLSRQQQAAPAGAKSFIANAGTARTVNVAPSERKLPAGASLAAQVTRPNPSVTTAFKSVPIEDRVKAATNNVVTFRTPSPPQSLPAASSPSTANVARHSGNMAALQTQGTPYIPAVSPSSGDVGKRPSIIAQHHAPEAAGTRGLYIAPASRGTETQQPTTVPLPPAAQPAQSSPPVINREPQPSHRDHAPPQQQPQHVADAVATLPVVEMFRDAERQQNAPPIEKSLDDRIKAVSEGMKELKKTHGDDYKQTEDYKLLLVEQKKLIEEKKKDPPSPPPPPGEKDPCGRPCGGCPTPCGSPQPQ